MQIRRPLLILAAALTLAACRPGALPVPTTDPYSRHMWRLSPPTPTSIPPTATATLTPTPAATPTLALPTLIPPTLAAGDFELRVHPDGGLFPGDQVSFEVISPQGSALSGEVAVILPDGALTEPAGFGGFGIGDRQQATLQWIWNTAGLAPGEYPVVFEIRPSGPAFTETVILLPPELQVFPEPGADWALAESDCCLFYYVTGTAAERDLDMLMDVADAEADLAIQQLGGIFEEPIEVVFLPRVLGHGGFAGGEIYISYLDRNYAGNAPGQVLHHEMVHILDGRKGGELRPSMFVEGLAVLLSGGHFKQEPIVPRAAALVPGGSLLTLSDLAGQFYFLQHEISYLQAAALIQYMSDTWGWEAFEAFYRDIHPHTSGLTEAAINQALLLHFGIGFAELETGFVAYLEGQPDDPAALVDVQLTVAFFDTVRRYQLALDPSAYFLTAWLIGIDEMIERRVTADYVRHPAAPENVALETLLVSADLALRAGDFPAAAALLEAVNAVLDGLALGDSAAFHAHPLAADYLALVLAAQALGYEAQQIHTDGSQATVRGMQGSVELVDLRFVRTSAGWEPAGE